MTRREWSKFCGAGLLAYSGKIASGQIMFHRAPPEVPQNGLAAHYHVGSIPGAQNAQIASWPDNTGNGNTATQATTNNKPQINLPTVSGRRSLYFAGAANGTPLGPCYMTIPSSLALSTQSCSIVVISEATIGAGGYAASIGTGGELFFNNQGGGKISTGTPNTTGTHYLSWGPHVWGVASGSGTTACKIILDAAFVQNATTITSAAATGGVINAFNASSFQGGMNVYEILFYNRQITQADLNQIYAHAVAHYAVRPLSTLRLIAVTGDSLSGGYVSNNYPGFLGQGWLQQYLIANPKETAYNFAVTGSLTSALQNPDAVFSVVAATHKVCTIWSGTNDMAQATGAGTAALSNIATAVAARRATGWKVLTCTCLPRGGSFGGGQTAPGFETDRLAFNVTLNANAGGIYGDAIADIGGDAVIGQAATLTNTTYYLNDEIHLTRAGNVIATGTYFGPGIQSL